MASKASERTHTFKGHCAKPAGSRGNNILPISSGLPRPATSSAAKQEHNHHDDDNERQTTTAQVNVRAIGENIRKSICENIKHDRTP